MPATIEMTALVMAIFIIILLNQLPAGYALFKHTTIHTPINHLSVKIFMEEIFANGQKIPLKLWPEDSGSCRYIPFR